MSYPAYSVDQVEPVFNKMIDQVRQSADGSSTDCSTIYIDHICLQKLVPQPIFSFYLSRWGFQSIWFRKFVSQVPNFRRDANATVGGEVISAVANSCHVRPLIFLLFRSWFLVAVIQTTMSHRSHTSRWVALYLHCFSQQYLLSAFIFRLTRYELCMWIFQN